MDRIKRVAVISGAIGQYDLINIFAKLLVEGFREIMPNDCECDLVEYNDELATNDNFEHITTYYDLIVTFNGIYVNFSNAPLRDYMINNNCLCLTFLIDHPYSHAERLKNSVNRQIVSCIDRSHVEYLHRFFDDLHHCVFIPHGAIIPDIAIKSWDEKVGNVAFFGSYSAPEQSLAIIANSAPETKETLIQIVEEIWNGRFNTLESSIEYVLKSYGVSITDAQLADIIADSVYLDTYIRNERRGLLIKELIASGIEVNLYGNGWEDLETEFKENLIIHKPLDLQSCINEMTKYKIVLNNMPLFANGSHERLFSIPAAGSILVTDTNPYVEEIFEEGKDYFKYSWDRIEELPKLISDILSDKMNVDSVIRSSREKVLENHLWKNRAQEILDYLEGNSI